jgi:putative hydrolase of the HAD superfamily
VPGVLSALRSRGLALGVVSNWDSTLPGLLDRVSLAGFFDVVVSSSSTGASKPSPAIFLEALSRLGIGAPDASEALHVGDSLEEDYHAARAAGLAALWLDRSGRGVDGDPAIPTISTLSGIERHL